MANPAQAQLELPATERGRTGARGTGDPALEGGGRGRALKKARREGRVIVFIDESGLSERPHRVRIWAPRTDSGAAISFRLESALGRGWHHLVELLLPSLSRCDPRPAGDGFSRPLAAPVAAQAVG